MQNMGFYNTFLKYAVLSAIVLCLSCNLAAQSNPQLARHKEKSLQHATTPSDSIRVLLDVYSLSDKINRDRVRSQIITLLQHSDNNAVINDVLNELARSTDDTRDLEKLIEISQNLPEDTAHDIQTILIMEKTGADAAIANDSEVKNNIADYIKQGMGMGADPYTEIQNIYRAMVYIGADSQGPLYFEYIKRMEELVNQLPEEDHAIRNLFYTTAALFYTRKRDYAKAIAYDKKLIEELDKIRKFYPSEERAEADLNYFYYVSYRRMLRNFKGLTPEEIEMAYQQCVDLAQKNEQAAKDFGTGGLTKSYYYMATHQYDKAIPELEKALDSPDISFFRRGELLGHLAFAMRNVGDSKGELEALREYSSMLLKDRRNRRDDMYREIELRNSVNKLLYQEYEQEQVQRQQNRVMRQTAITLVYVLALILIFVVQAYFRLRHKVKELEIRNNKLHRNIEYIFDDGIPKGSQDLRHKNKGLKG